MTGYGHAEAEFDGGQLTVEMRSVNSRHLDVRPRLPRDLAGLEAIVRAAVQRHFARGQLEVNVRLPPAVAAEPEVAVNHNAVRRYLAAARELGDEFGVAGGITLEGLLALPGVVRVQDAALEPDALAGAVVAAVEAACLDTGRMREREGATLARDLAGRTKRVAELVGEIEARAETVVAAARERLERRIAKLAPELELDPARLDQEVVFWADRADVTEETVRLRSHLEQFAAALEGDGPVGRRLEFLLQELGREVNTIGSKAADAPIGAAVVEIKTELEKLREQVLNVE